jgi:hypothetical protein
VFGGVFRLGSWRRVLAWAVPAASRPTSEEQRSVLLVLAWLVFRPGRWQRVHYGRWRRGLAWAVPAASGLAVAECLLGQRRNVFEREMGQKIRCFNNN